MANIDLPNGFIPKGVPLRVNAYVAGSTIYPGDMVMEPASDGQVDASAGGAAELLLGCALSYATVGQDVLIADHPSQLFVVQADSTSVDNADDMGDYCEVKNTSGSATYKLSRHEIDTVAATATKPLRLAQVLPRIGNSIANGANVKVVVAINTHALQS